MVSQANLLCVDALNGEILCKKRYAYTIYLTIANSCHVVKCIAVEFNNLIFHFAVTVFCTERLFRYAVEECVEVGDTYHGVTATNVMVEERKRLTCTIALNPEHHLAKFNGIGVIIDCINALLNHLAESLTVVERSGVFLACANRADIPSNGASHSEYDMPGAGGCIAHFHRKERLHLIFRSVVFADAFFDYRFESGANKILHQVGASVIGRSTLSVETTNVAELPAGTVVDEVDVWAHFKNALIHRAEFLHVERRIIDFDHLPALVGKLVESGERFEQLLIVDGAFFDIVQSVVAEKHTAKRFNAEFITDTISLEQTERID